MRDVYLQRYARSTVEHYQFADVRFADIEGYEYYAGLAKNIAKHGLEKFNGFLADLQVWGSPRRGDADKLLDYVAPHRRRRGARDAASYGGMPPDGREGQLRPVRREVLPALQAHDVGGDIGVTHAAATAPAARPT